MARIAWEEHSILLISPLGGAIFSKDDVTKISDELEVLPWQAAQMINSSTASGGQYIAQSSMAFAVVASLVATKNIKSEEVKSSKQ